MGFSLGDDGTMDTVTVCDECGQEIRYNFDGGHDCTDTDEAAEVCDCYDLFAQWALEDAETDHECIPTHLRSVIHN